MFEELKAYIKAEYPTSQLTPMPAAKIAVLEEYLAFLPKAYFKFLAEIGTGTIGDDVLQIFEEPVTDDEFFGDEDTSDVPCLLIGDDFNGVAFGFLDAEDEQTVFGELESDGAWYDIDDGMETYLWACLDRELNADIGVEHEDADPAAEAGDENADEADSDARA